MPKALSPRTESQPEPGHRAGWWLPAALALGLFTLLAWPLILSGFVQGRGAGDQLNYHEQVIRTFAAQWPHPDYGDYLSATTPGYHTLLAAIAHHLSDDRRLLQLAASGFTLGLLLLLARGCSRADRADGTTPAQPTGVVASTVLLLPTVVSMPVFYSGVWLLPDNAGWLGVLAIWLLALRPRFDMWTVAAGGAILAALVFVRQIHIWPLAMLLAGAWLGARDRPDREFDFALDLRHLLSEPLRRISRAALVLLAALPAVAILLWFWNLWGGLTPPVFHERHVGGNPAAPAFVLAVFGVLSLFFVPFVLDGLRRLWVRHTWLLALALGAGLLFALAAPTTYSVAEGRYSGLWNIAKHLPAPLDRSLFITPLAVLGALLVAAWVVTLARRERWIMLAALVAFTAAQCASFQLWQRYNEPFVLLWLALAAARVQPARSGAGEGWRVAGPLALAGTLAAVTAISLVLARPVKPREFLAPWETEAPILPGMKPSHPAGESHVQAASDRSKQAAPA
jgi:hypothetical protein